MLLTVTVQGEGPALRVLLLHVRPDVTVEEESSEPRRLPRGTLRTSSVASFLTTYIYEVTFSYVINVGDSDVPILGHPAARSRSGARPALNSARTGRLPQSDHQARRRRW